MTQNVQDSVMLTTLHETRESLLAQLREIDEWLKDGSANEEEYDALLQEKTEIELQVYSLCWLQIFKTVLETNVNGRSKRLKLSLANYYDCPSNHKHQSVILETMRSADPIDQRPRGLFKSQSGQSITISRTEIKIALRRSLTAVGYLSTIPVV